MSKLFVAIVFLLTLGGAGRATANTLLNTVGGDGGAYAVSSSPSFAQSVGIQFSTGSNTQVTGVEAYIGTSGTVELGLMADVNGLPSGTFITGDTAVASLSFAPINLTSLGWSVSPESTYWLVAVNSSDTLTLWSFNSSVSAVWSFTHTSDGSGSWSQQTSSSPPQAIITGGATITPLPAALPLFATGLAGLGLLGWRRKRKAQVARGVQPVWSVYP